MLLKYFYDDRLAQASYMVGCAATGQALVVDPMRDIAPYLQMAQKEGLRITHVTETHIHADFVSGSRELAAATGASLYLSSMGGPDWQYAYADQPNVILVGDGDMFMVGNIKIEVLHTPGHTPEHISFMVTDTKGANLPMGIFTGDFVFVGDIGRPDLLEEAAGVVGTKEVGARDQFRSIKRIAKLPDYLQIWPGHGAGSACGKALGAIPSTTLGYEKMFSPAFQFVDEEKFVAWLLDGQPEPPRYFAQMKKVNKLGPALLRELPTVQHMDRAAIDAHLAADDLVIDLRPREDFIKAHLPGTLSIPATSANFTTYVGWFVDFDRPLSLIVPQDADLDGLVTALRAIGVDHIAGYAHPDVITANDALALPIISAAELAERLPKNGMTVLDVRNKTEYDEIHIPNSKHIPLGYLPKRQHELNKDGAIVVHCASGYRSQVASSWLRANGFKHVINLVDGKEVWSAALPTVTE